MKFLTLLFFLPLIIRDVIKQKFFLIKVNNELKNKEENFMKKMNKFSSKAVKAMDDFVEKLDNPEKDVLGVIYVSMIKKEIVFSIFILCLEDLQNFERINKLESQRDMTTLEMFMRVGGLRSTPFLITTIIGKEETKNKIHSTVNFD